MNCKIGILIMLLLCSVSAVLAQDKMKTNKNDQMLIDREKTAWAHLVNKKYDDFARMLSDDYQGVYSNGTTTKTAEMSNLKAVTFKSADVSDLKVQWVDKNTAIVTSTVKAEVALPDGQTINRNIRATSVVAKRGKEWLCVYHTDTVIEGM